ELTAHYGSDCPVAVGYLVSQPEEIILRGTLADIADQVEAHGLRQAAVIIVGPALTASGFVDSHLYSDRPRG
ncbi:MAG: precorrin-4 C(11)-methyltransferase, partial [Ornithinimicrobium sp.]